MKNRDETRNDFIKEINQNELINKKHKKVCRILNYIEYLLILISIVSGCVFISAYYFLVGIPIGSTSSAIGLKISVITAGIVSIIKKKKKGHDKIVLLEKSKLNSTEVLISKALIVWNIIHNEFVLMNNVLKEFYVMKEELKN